MTFSPRTLSTQDRRQPYAELETEPIPRLRRIGDRHMAYPRRIGGLYKYPHIDSIKYGAPNLLCGNRIDLCATIIKHVLALEGAGLSTMCPWVA